MQFSSIFNSITNPNFNSNSLLNLYTFWTVYKLSAISDQSTVSRCTRRHNYTLVTVFVWQ